MLKGSFIIYFLSKVLLVLCRISQNLNAQNSVMTHHVYKHNQSVILQKFFSYLFFNKIGFYIYVPLQ